MGNNELIRYRLVGDHIANIELNRPSAKNAINTSMRSAFSAALDQAETDDKVRVIILSAAGSVFSAGNDIKEPDSYGDAEEFIIKEYKPLLDRLLASEKITISAVQGTVAGIGIAFAMSCDICIMTDTASIYPAFINIALVPDGGASWHLAKAMGYRKALEAAILGRKIPAHECLNCGLINSITVEEELFNSAKQLAEAISMKSPLAVRKTKEVMRASTDLDLQEMIELEARVQNTLTASKDYEEALNAFIEKREPVFE